MQKMPGSQKFQIGRNLWKKIDHKTEWVWLNWFEKWFFTEKPFLHPPYMKIVRSYRCIKENLTARASF